MEFVIYAHLTSLHIIYEIENKTTRYNRAGAVKKSGITFQQKKEKLLHVLSNKNLQENDFFLISDEPSILKAQKYGLKRQFIL